MKVCLFGGSFDPVHNGHKKIVSKLANEFDEVWVIVAASSPFKAKHFASFKMRVEMCKLALEKDNVKVLTVEDDYGLSYTYDVVMKIKSLYPNHDYYFAIGADNVDNLHKWKNIDLLKNMITFTSFSRNGQTGDYQFDDKHSSTVCRVTKETGIDCVDEYIKNNKLYISKYEEDYEFVRNNVSDRRFAHIVQTASLAQKLAKTHNVDEEKCVKAAIYHDYFKEASEKEVKTFIENNLEYETYPPAILHGFMFEDIVDKVNNDVEIVEAIKYHPVGYDKMKDVGKILYLADYLEPTRMHHEEVKWLLDKAFKSLNAYEECVINRTLYIVSKEGCIHPKVYMLVKNIMEENNERIKECS